MTAIRFHLSIKGNSPVKEKSVCLQSCQCLQHLKEADISLPPFSLSPPLPPSLPPSHDVHLPQHISKSSTSSTSNPNPNTPTHTPIPSKPPTTQIHNVRNPHYAHLVARFRSALLREHEATILHPPRPGAKACNCARVMAVPHASADKCRVCDKQVVTADDGGSSEKRRRGGGVG